VGRYVGEEKMKAKFCLFCGKELIPDGSIQAHRRMYCGEAHKWAMAKLVRRRKAKGEPMPWEEPGWKPGTDLRTYAEREASPKPDRPAKPKPPKPMVWVRCEGCGKMWEVPNNGMAKRRCYCSDECIAKVRRQKQLAAYHAKHQPAAIGGYGLESDPWRSGVLPAEIRANALWS
jgi:hypothetical protein